MKACSRLLFAILAIGALAVPRSGRAEEASILNGSVAVEAASYRHYTVRVDGSVMRDAAVVGHVQATGGTGNDIEITVLTESDFLNWKNAHAQPPLYSSGRVTAADVRVSLPESGTYYVVVSNTFSALTPKTVEGSLTLTWTPPPPPPLPPASTNANAHPGTSSSLTTLLLLLGAAGVGAASAWFGFAQHERKKAAAEAARKAA